MFGCVIRPPQNICMSLATELHSAWPSVVHSRLQAPDDHTACICTYLCLFKTWTLLVLKAARCRQLRAAVPYYSLGQACSGKLRWMRTERSPCRCAFHTAVVPACFQVASLVSRLARCGDMVSDQQAGAICLKAWRGRQCGSVLDTCKVTKV